MSCLRRTDHFWLKSDYPNFNILFPIQGQCQYVGTGPFPDRIFRCSQNFQINSSQATDDDCISWLIDRFFDYFFRNYFLLNNFVKNFYKFWRSCKIQHIQFVYSVSFIFLITCPHTVYSPFENICWFLRIKLQNCLLTFQFKLMRLFCQKFLHWPWI